VRAALAYEWVRIRTIRSTWWLTGIAAFIGLLIAFGVGWGSASQISAHPDSIGGGDLDLLGPVVVSGAAAAGAPCLVGFVLAMLGIFAWGHEYRHGMIRASLTALNSRAALWVAKFAVVGVWAAGITLLVGLASGGLGWLFLHEYSVPVFSARAWGVLGREVGYVVVLAWLAMAFTALTRSQAFALVVIFLWPLLVESVVTIILQLTPGLRDHADLARFLPFGAGARMIDVTRPADGFFGDPLSPAGGFVVFGGLAAVLMAASWVLLQRRDA
jgi:ABC-type transport system involved in multi-copper enzyme maturation permease subunit